MIDVMIACRPTAGCNGLLTGKTSYLAKVDSVDCSNTAELTGRDDTDKTVGEEEPVGQIGAPVRSRSSVRTVT